MHKRQYIRKPFPVEAVQVTEENFEEVAKWCGGSVKPDAEDGNYIRVRVKHPLNARQTRAYVGDWVLKAGDSFKVYTAKAFENSFQDTLAPTQEETFNIFDGKEEEITLTRADFEKVNPATSR